MLNLQCGRSVYKDVVLVLTFDDHNVTNTVIMPRGRWAEKSLPTTFLFPHADRHAGDISFRPTVSVVLQCMFVCNGYLRLGLTQGDEIWQDGRSRWVAGHLYFW